MELMQASDLPSTPRAQQKMPSFARGTHAHAHNLHSALTTLEAMGISAHRIVVRRRGRYGVPAGSVVGQKPAADSVLHPDSIVELDIAGLGFVDSLPVGMWDSGGETHAGTREIFEAFDDPLEKLKHWFHEGAPLFRIRPDDPAACSRWLELFGVDASTWPKSLRYRLASLIATLPQLSCSREGAAFLLQTLLDLPVSGFFYRPTSAELPEEAWSRLGRKASRLGVDAVLGQHMEDLATLEIEIGPVQLSTYERFQETSEGRQLLARTLRLVMPVSQEFDLRWSVMDRNQGPRLGVRECNARLGINTYMGAALLSAIQVSNEEIPVRELQ